MFPDPLVVTVGFGGPVRPRNVVSIRRGTVWSTFFKHIAHKCEVFVFANLRNVYSFAFSTAAHPAAAAACFAAAALRAAGSGLSGLTACSYSNFGDPSLAFVKEPPEALHLQ